VRVDEKNVGLAENVAFFWQFSAVIFLKVIALFDLKLSRC
jgi:hypothetical protein